MRFTAIILSLLTLPLLSQEKISFRPFWVEQFLSQGAYDAGPSFYWGVGTSKISSEEADSRARKEFSLMVQTEIRSTFVQVLRERNGILQETTVDSLIQRSEMTLHGLPISGRYYDGQSGSYFTLIQFDREVYTRTLREEVERVLERIRIANLAAEEERREELRKREVILDLKRQKEQQELDEKEFYERKYGQFLRALAPNRVVTLRNSELDPSENTIGLRMTISPFHIPSLYIARRWWRMEFSLNSILDDWSLRRQDLSVKLNFLDATASTLRITGAIGVVSYTNSIGISKIDRIPSQRYLTSPFLTSQISLPGLAYSHFSLYLDKRLMSVGMVGYPFWNSVGNAVGFVFQADLIKDPGYRNLYGDLLMFQAGIRFQTSGGLVSSIAYEEHRHIVISFDINI